MNDPAPAAPPPQASERHELPLLMAQKSSTAGVLRRVDDVDNNNETRERIQSLEATVHRLTLENAALRRRQGRADAAPDPSPTTNNSNNNALPPPSVHSKNPVVEKDWCSALTAAEIERYSRQLILSESDGFGVKEQLHMMRDSSVLVIGAGGIASTLLLYLAAAGVGCITIFDFDTVQPSNLHRQVLYSNAQVGQNKAVAAKAAMLRLNPTLPNIVSIPHAFGADDAALQTVAAHTVVVDASDNPATRYLVNDACVLAGHHTPLVSGSAVGTQGQVTVYNYSNVGSSSGCYRCLYPNPALQSECRSCADAGVLGPVPGVIGLLQAMEVLKILAAQATSNSSGFGARVLHDRLVLYDGASCTFAGVKKPKARRTDCPVCGSQPTIRSMADSQRNLQDTRGPSISPLDATTSTSTGGGDDDDPDDETRNVSCLEYQRIRQQGEAHVLLDVRVERQFALCSLPGSVNIPLEQLMNNNDAATTCERIANTLSKNGAIPVFCICRRGIASNQATHLLNSYYQSPSFVQSPVEDNGNEGTEERPKSIPLVRNILGGLVAWQSKVDSSFPTY